MAGPDGASRTEHRPFLPVMPMLVTRKGKKKHRRASVSRPIERGVSPANIEAVQRNCPYQVPTDLNLRESIQGAGAEIKRLHLLSRINTMGTHCRIERWDSGETNRS